MVFSVFVTDVDSPVRAASSTFKLAHSINLESAGTASPASNRIISPGTRSSERTLSILSFLITFDVAAAIS